ARVRDRPPSTCLTTFPKLINWQVSDVIIASNNRSSRTRSYGSGRSSLVCLDCDYRSFGPPAHPGARAATLVASTVRGACPSRRLRKTTIFACFLYPTLIGHEAPYYVCSTRREGASPEGPV
ncbi:unnamed protein product, partial [Ectocarpus sp. 8 AP-2014]